LTWRINRRLNVDHVRYGRLGYAEVLVGQFGARLETEFRGPGGMNIEPTFGFYAYTDLALTGNTPVGIPGRV
jgi:hypothetical protein